MIILSIARSTTNMDSFIVGLIFEIGERLAISRNESNGNRT